MFSLGIIKAVERPETSSDAIGNEDSLASWAILLLAHLYGQDNITTFTSEVKARVNNFGIASALLQHEWRPKSLFTISAEVDTWAIEKSAKVGLALALKLKKRK
nr:eukaryotic porin/Tom40 [Tanacetum cinerariifolium]